jgi:hypothetical protein
MGPGRRGAGYGGRALRPCRHPGDRPGPGSPGRRPRATGGIGTALVQLLHAEGVEVTAVCDRLPPGRPDLLTELGAARVVELDGGQGWARSEVASTRWSTQPGTPRSAPLADCSDPAAATSPRIWAGGGRTSCSP